MIRTIERWRVRRLAQLAKQRSEARKRARPEAVFLGDSITEFWPDNDPVFFLRHRWVNAGISGETTREMVRRFEDDVVALRPRVVHIMGGTNDLWQGVPGESGADVFAHIETMLRMTRAAGIAAVLASPPPIGAQALHHFREPNLLPTLIAGIAALAREHGAVHVDYATVLSADGREPVAAFTTDGVHLTRKGYLAMRARATRAIGEALRHAGNGKAL